MRARSAGAGPHSPGPVTRQPRPMRRLLAFPDPLLGRATLVVKPHDGTIRGPEIRHDEADAREQLANVVLKDPSRALGVVAEIVKIAFSNDAKRADGRQGRLSALSISWTRSRPRTYACGVGCRLVNAAALAQRSPDIN